MFPYLCMENKDLIRVKEIPEFIEVSVKGEKKKFRNIPVSGVVANFPTFENRRFGGGDFYAPFIRLMDPRGFNVDIDYNDFIDLIKHSSINNGVIDSEIQYSIVDYSDHFCHPVLHTADTGLAPITKSMKVVETISSGKELVPGNRYHIIDSDRAEKGIDKEFVYIGKTTIQNTITFSYSTCVVDLWIDPDTMEITTFRYNNRFASLCWVVDKQHPADLDLLKAAQDRLIGSVFENDGKNIVKIEINPGATISSKEDFDINTFTTISDRRWDANIRTAFFVKKYDDEVIEILELFASISYRNTWADVIVHTYKVIDGRVKITYNRHEHLGNKREILKFYKSEIKYSLYDYINLTDNKELLNLCETTKQSNPIISCTFVDGCSFNLGLIMQPYNMNESIKLKMRDV